MRNEPHTTQALDESLLALPLKPRGIGAPVHGLAPHSLSRRPSSKDVWRALLTLVPDDEMPDGVSPSSREG